MNGNIGWREKRKKKKEEEGVHRWCINVIPFVVQ